MKTPRRKLADILHDRDRTSLENAWGKTEPSRDFHPLPKGEYVARITDARLDTARTGTLGFKITFSILEGEHAGRMLWHTLWLTPAAMPIAKRDLMKLGIQSLDQLEEPLPRGIRCRISVALRLEEDGTKYNRVRSYEFIGIDPPEVDPFAPAALREAPDGHPLSGDFGRLDQISHEEPAPEVATSPFGRGGPLAAERRAQ